MQRGRSGVLRHRAPLTAPLNIRLPADLRDRIRKFAASRQLSEAAAIRSMLQDRLAELPVLEDVERARRWQVEQVWEDAKMAIDGVGAEATWRNILSSHGRAISAVSARREQGRRRRVTG